MTLGVEFPIDMGGPLVRRIKTHGVGTMRGTDFKNSAVYPDSITPTTSIPSGTQFFDLPDVTQNMTAQFTMNGATTQAVGVAAGVAVSALGTGTGGKGTYTLSSSDLIGNSDNPVEFTFKNGSIIVGVGIGYISDGAGATGNVLNIIRMTFGSVTLNTIVSGGGGGINVGGGTAISVLLAPEFLIPALTGLDAHYLIILGLTFKQVTTPGTAEYIAGFQNAGTINWNIYRNSGNANYFSGFSGSNATIGTGVIKVGQNRIALELIKDATARTIQHKVYVNGVFQINGSIASAVDSVLQPAASSPGKPAIGGTQAGYWATGGRANSAEIINLNAAGETRSVADIVSTDYATWGYRFS